MSCRSLLLFLLMVLCDDPQAKLEMMTPGVRRDLHQFLGQSGTYLLQLGNKVSLMAATTTTTTTTAALTYVVNKVQTDQKPIPSIQWKEGSGPVDCGLFRDTMSPLRERFKDPMDVPRAGIVINIEGQLGVFCNQKIVFMEKLAEAISNGSCVFLCLKKLKKEVGLQHCQGSMRGIGYPCTCRPPPC